MDKDAKITELENLVASLRQQLKVANETIRSLRQKEIKRQRYDLDYLPYEERDR